MKNKWVKGILITVGILFVILIGVRVYRRFFGGTAAVGEMFVKAVASKGEISVGITATGTVTSTVQQNVNCPYNGTITSLSVGTGDTIATGSVIAQVDSNNITSPITGVISSVNISLGDAAQKNRTIASIVDPLKIQINVPVDELDIARVKVGQTCSVKIDALPDRSFTGQVTKVSSIGNTINNVTTYNVAVSVLNPVDVKIGMTANVTIQITDKKNVVMLPLEAIQENSNGKKFVILSEAASNSKNKNIQTAVNEKVQQVETGIYNENYVEIVSGISEGQEVLIPIPDMTNGNSQPRVLNFLRGGKNTNKAAGTKKNRTN